MPHDDTATRLTRTSWVKELTLEEFEQAASTNLNNGKWKVDEEKTKASAVPKKRKDGADGFLVHIELVKKTPADFEAAKAPEAAKKSSKTVTLEEGQSKGG